MGARRGGEDDEEATIGSDIIGTVGVSLRVAEDMFDGGKRVGPNSMSLSLHGSKSIRQTGTFFSLVRLKMGV